MCCRIWDGWRFCIPLNTTFLDLTGKHFCRFRVADVLRDLGRLEILQAPGLPYIIPREYAELPHLTGIPAHLFMSMPSPVSSLMPRGLSRWAAAAKTSGHDE